MTDNRAFSHVNVAVGSFVLLALLVLVAIIVQGGRIRDWFSPSVTLTLQLPPEGSHGLKEGSRVLVMGTEVGTIRRILFGARGGDHMYAEARIREAFMRYVRSDSVAVIKKTFGVAGDAYVEIAKGTGTPVDPETDEIETRADAAPTEALDFVMQQIDEEVKPTLRDLRAGVGAWIELTARMQEPLRELTTTLSHASAIAARLERGEGTVGALLADDTLAKDLRATAQELRATVANLDASVQRLPPIMDDIAQVAKDGRAVSAVLKRESADLPGVSQDVKSTLAEIQALLADLREVSARLPASAANLEVASGELPGVIRQTQSTLRETELFIEGLQRHWLFGGGAGSGAGSATGGRIAPERASP